MRANKKVAPLWEQPFYYLEGRESRKVIRVELFFPFDHPCFFNFGVFPIKRTS